jgi:penicillin-binding protein 2
VAAVANGGTLYRPRLIKQIASADGSFIDDQFAPEVTRTVDLDPAVLPIVRDDLVGVVNSPLGTARRSQLPKEWGITVAGKTGTSQVVALEHKDKSKNFEHHALFAAYAPAEAPEIVVVAVVEHVGSGGLHAAPVVRQVLEAYFMKTRSLVMPDSPTR